MEENKDSVSKLDNILLVQAREELGETDELREECILTMRQWLQTEEKCYPLGIISLIF